MSWRGWLCVLAAFMVLLVNATYIYLAGATFSGEITANSYDKGLAYNKVIAQETQQSSKISGTIELDKKGEVVFTASEPCTSAVFSLLATTGKKADILVEFPQESSSYRLQLQEVHKGPWLVRITCYMGEEAFFFSKKIAYK